ncbi:MAG TPA: glycosyltransferase family 4 protein, partial [Gallicola sp.]|nr:glycosyltransferase family 4 protein [Gallicola sp.]
KEEIIDGVKIISLKTPKNRIVRMTKTLLECYRKAVKIDADLYHFHDPELIFVGWLLKKKGKKVIYDVHEDVSKDIINKYWIWKPVRILVAKITGYIEKSISLKLDGIITATSSISQNFKYVSEKLIVINNYALINELYQENKIKPEGRFSGHFVVYVGSITVERGAKEMLEAMDLLPQDCQVKLLLGGNFVPPLLKETLERMQGWRRVDYMGWLDRNQIASVFRKTQVGLVLFHPEPNHIEAQPNKLFEYMSAGLPVIASHFPLWKEIVEGNRCGLTINPLNPQEIADAIRYIFENPNEAEEMGQRGREAVETKYNWLKEEKKLLAFYELILNT